MAEHCPTESLEACWGLFSLLEFEGLSCVHDAITLVRFDLPASHLESTLSADESCPESCSCLPNRARLLHKKLWTLLWNSLLRPLRLLRWHGCVLRGQNLEGWQQVCVSTVEVGGGAFSLHPLRFCWNQLTIVNKAKQKDTYTGPSLSRQPCSPGFDNCSHREEIRCLEQRGWNWRSWGSNEALLEGWGELQGDQGFLYRQSGSSNLSCVHRRAEAAAAGWVCVLPGNSAHKVRSFPTPTPTPCQGFSV